jgi:hypothetical protein
MHLREPSAALQKRLELIDNAKVRRSPVFVL